VGELRVTNGKRLSMKITIKAAFLVLLLLSTAWAYQKVVKRSKYVDETYGYTIETPKFPGAGPTTPGTALIVTGPAADGFAPNVNVNIQATATTAKAFHDLSVGQFKQLGCKLNSDRQIKVSGRDAVEFDYEGTLGGDKTLRFLSLAVIDKDRVILVTCTASPESFKTLEAEFRACINSLKLP
jgi:hypothetical protein